MDGLNAGAPDHSARPPDNPRIRVSPPNPWTKPLRPKVPQPTALFWFSTLLAGCLGASVAEYLFVSVGLDLPSTTAVLSLLLAAGLIGQLATSSHVPATYWLVVILLSGAGVAYQDNLLVETGAGPWLATVIPAVFLTAVLIVWRHFEGALTMASISTRRRESLFWLAALCATAVGDALDNLLTGRLGLDHLTAMVVLAALVVLVALAHAILGLASSAGFWAAYVLIRPVGAAVVDLLTDPRHHGGLGLTGPDCAGLLLLLLLLAVFASTLRTRGATRPVTQTSGRTADPHGTR